MWKSDAEGSQPKKDKILESLEPIYWLLADNIDFKHPDWEKFPIYYEVNETRVYGEKSFPSFLSLHYFNLLEHSQRLGKISEVEKYFEICKQLEALYSELKFNTEIDFKHPITPISSPVKDLNSVNEYVGNFEGRFKFLLGDDYPPKISIENAPVLRFPLLSKLSFSFYFLSPDFIHERPSIEIESFYRTSLSCGFFSEFFPSFRNQILPILHIKMPY